MKLLRAIHPLLLEARSFVQRRYPAFVTSARPPALDATGVPVFMFHTVEPATFELQLRHVAENGYATLDCEQLYRFATGEEPLRQPSVMITFDDGERSLYQVAFPLLRKYGLRAVNFIVTGRVHETDATRPAHGKQWLTWPKVQEMHAAGVIDFQSHTEWHENMFVGDQRTGFLTPEGFTDELLVDRPLVRRHGQDELLQALGAPLFPLAPRMTDRRKWIDDEAAREACIAHVAAHGGSAFFQQPGWEQTLEQVWCAALAGRPAGIFETPTEQRAAILASLRNAREQLESRLQRPVRHLAYPWATGSALSVELSREAGYVTNFWGPLPRTPLNRAGQDPLYLARLKDDYILRLPGRGRWRLADVIRMKAKRRREKADIY